MNANLFPIRQGELRSTERKIFTFYDTKEVEEE